MVRQLTRRDARRIAIRAQLLDAHRPRTLHDLVRHLTLLQLEPTAAIAPSPEVVAWSRLGPSFDARDLEAAVTSGSLVELRMMLRPAEDLALFTAEMAAWPGTGPLRDWQADTRDWVLANDDCRRDILEKLHDEGPLPSSALPDTTVVPWQSSGWNDDRNVRMLLEQMVRRGEVAAAGYDGRTRLWDLAERVYPDDPPVPLPEALHVRASRVLRSLGLARPRDLDTRMLPIAEDPSYGDPLTDVGEPAVVEGVRGKWRVDPAYLEGDFAGRTALLSPLDRLVFDRKKLAELFGFDYQLEMYKPKAKRRWGYWALPILDGDGFVGKVDATAERERGVLRVDAIHEDAPFSKALARRVHAELVDLADWLDLELELPGQLPG